jgi:hypothetical protein
MNYSEAISYIFRDQDWAKKIGIGGFCLFVAVFSGILFFVAIFGIGYYLSVLRHVLNGEEKPLPEWATWNKFFSDGLMGAIILFVYFVVIGGLGAIIIVNLALANDLADYERVLGIVFTAIGIYLGIVTFGNLGLIRFAATNDFGAAFRLTEIFNLFKNDFGNYLTIVIFTSILNAMLFLAGLGIFSPFTNFWGYMVQAHLFGQYAKGVQATTPAVQSA